MVLIRPRFDWQSLQFDRATAFGLALACNLLVFGLLTVPLGGDAPPRSFMAPEPPLHVESLRVTPPPEALPVPPPPVPPERPPQPVLQPLVQAPVEVVLAVAPVALEQPSAMNEPVQAISAPAGPPVQDFVEARAAYGYSPPPPYPGSAVRRGLQGEVMLRVRVDAEGRVLAVEVERSSGHRELDRAAERQVRERWRFQPAQRAGRAVSSWVRVPIHFRLDRG
jgi:periplasmic protein TonB